MNKIKSFLVVLVISLVMGISNVYADAYTLDGSKAEISENTTTIPLKISDATGLTGKSATFTINTSFMDVDFSFKEATNYQLSKDESSGGTYFTGSMVEGNIIGYLILTNNSSNDLVGKTIELKADGATTPKVLVDNVTIKAKVVTTTTSSSNDATLHSLTTSVGTITPEYSADTTDYVIYNIKDTINKVTLNYTLDSAATAELSADGSVTNNKTITLNKGKNIAKLVITAGNKTTKTINFVIYRGETAYNSSKLATLTTKDATTYVLAPTFSADVLDYTLTVPYAVTTVQNILSFTQADTEASMEVKGIDNLVVGENTMTIKITNQTGSETTTYTIKITRQAKNANDIDVIKYKDGKVTYVDSTGATQELSESDFKTKYPDQWNLIEDGTYKFDDDGNIIKESDDTTETNKESNLWLIILLIAVGVLVIVGAALYIFKFRKNKNKKDKGNKKDKKNDEEINHDEAEPEEQVEDPKEVANSENIQTPDEIDTYDEEARLISDENKKSIQEELEDVELGNDDEDKNIDDTMDIDEALSDLMNTKEYHFDKKNK